MVLASSEISYSFPGECVCGKCKCNSGFEGKFCQRSLYKSACEKLKSCIIFKTFGEQDDIEHYKKECDMDTMIENVKIFGSNIRLACKMNEINDTSGKNYFSYR